MAFMKSDILLDEWYGKGRDMQLPKPKTILTHIDHLSFSKSARFSARYHYELLSEMAHPNMFSFSLLQAAFHTDPDGLEVTRVEARPQSARAVYGALMPIAEPISECVPQALSDLAEMEREISAVDRLGAQLRHYLKN